MQTQASQSSSPERLQSDGVDPVIIRCLLPELQLRGLDVEGLLATSGLSVEDVTNPDLHVAGAQVVVAINRAIDMIGKPDLLGLQLGCSFNLVSWGPLFLGLQACADRDQLLSLAVQHMPTVGRAVQFLAEDRTTGTRLLHVRANTEPAVQVFLAHFALAALSRACRHVLGAAARLRAIEFKSASPSGFERYVRSLGVPVLWSRPADCLVMDLESARIDSADPVTLLRVQAWLVHFYPVGPRRSELELKVRRAIAGAGGATPSLEEIAASLHLTDRTVRRRLAAASLKYSELVDDHRRERVMALIRTEATLDQIAHDAGFSDIRSLRRAVTRWTGRTLSELLRRSRGSPSGRAR